MLPLTLDAVHKRNSDLEHHQQTQAVELSNWKAKHDEAVKQTEISNTACNERKTRFDAAVAELTALRTTNASQQDQMDKLTRQGESPENQQRIQNYPILLRDWKDTGKLLAFAVGCAGQENLFLRGAHILRKVDGCLAPNPDDITLLWEVPSDITVPDMDGKVTR